MTDRRTLRWFGHPLIVLGLAAFLAVDFAAIDNRGRNRSEVREWVFPHSRRAAISGRSLPGFALRTAEGVEWLWWDDPRADAPQDHGAPLGIWYQSFVSKSGFYHLTSRRISVHATGESVLSPEEGRALRQSIAATIDSDEDRRAIFRFEPQTLTNPDAYLSGVYERQWPIRAGYIRNGIAAGMLALLLGCFFLGRTWRWIPIPSPAEARRHKRMQRGQCLSCGYDLGGLPGAPACPECGERRVYCS